MKRYVLRLLTLSMTLFLLLGTLLLSACSDGSENTPDTTPSPGATTAPTETEKEPTPTHKSEAEMIEEEVNGYNYIVGTQAFNPNYQFTERSALSEISERIVNMGSNMVKFYATDVKMIDTLIEERPEIKYIFMWYRSDPYWKDANGYTEEEKQNDYDMFYALTKRLLKKYTGSGITFYLGHWEGDWYYLDNYNTNQKTVSEAYTQGMIDWLNNRQKAVDDAKAAIEYEDVEVWNYLELNRPTDALDYGYDRVVNKVLPCTNIDYVSYSAYDCMYMSGEKIQKVIDYIYENLPEKEGVEGPRVFVGEFGQPAANCGYDDEEHARQNLEMFYKYLSCNVKYVLFWQMYDNEKLEDGYCRGFWLITDQNEETALYGALESILSAAKRWVRDYRTQNGFLPPEDEYRAFLLTLPEFAGFAD